MTYRRRRRGALWLMLLLLAAAVALLEKATYDRIQKEGSYIENLSFVTGNSASKQIIRCFADETENTIYLFLPSYEELEAMPVVSLRRLARSLNVAGMTRRQIRDAKKEQLVEVIWSFLEERRKQP